MGLHTNKDLEIVYILKPAPKGSNYNYNLVFLLASFLASSLFIYYHALFLIIMMILLSIIPFLSIIPKSWKLSGISLKIIESLVHIIFLLGFLHMLTRWYNFLMHKLSYLGFQIFTYILGFLVLCYILLCRYLFLLKINHKEIPFLIVMLTVILSCVLIIKGLTTFTLFFIPYVFNNFKSFWTTLKVVEPPLVEEAGSSASNPKALSFGFFFNRHTHNHYYPPEVPRTNFYRNVGIAFGCVGLCLSTFACYQYRLSALAAQRSADATEVAAGLRSQESYYKKWGDSPKK